MGKSSLLELDGVRTSHCWLCTRSLVGRESDRPPLMFDPNSINKAAFSYYERLARLDRYVEKHLAEEIARADAARVAGLEVNYFSTFFHRKTGVLFRDWLAHRRVNHAKQLLKEKNLSITEVSLDAGFTDLRTFERAFKKHAGRTPFAYKKKVRPS